MEGAFHVKKMAISGQLPSNSEQLALKIENRRGWNDNGTLSHFQNGKNSKGEELAWHIDH